MKHLQAIGELDSTLVVFTSDNGYLWGEHNLTSKFVPYRKAVEVPLLIRWPGHVAAGAVDERWVAHVDISPTLLAAAGVTSTVVPMDGRDIFSGYARPQAFTEYFLDEWDTEVYVARFRTGTPPTRREALYSGPPRE